MKVEKEKAELKYKIRAKELQLRIRGLEEEDEENIRERILNIFSELVERLLEEIDRELDQVYRLKFRIAEQRKYTSDVLVNVLTRRLKEEILRQSILNPIEYNGKKVRILRKLPRQVLWDRKIYRKLTEKLIKKNKRFRWELPNGLSFVFKEERKLITTEEQLNRFLLEKADDLDV